MQVNFRKMEHHLEVVISGKYSFQSFFTLIDRIKKEGEKNGRTNIVIDYNVHVWHAGRNG